MSSTSNVQDLLVNVFRPTYRYDSNVGFVPSLVLSNVSEVITDRLRTGAFTVSDSNRNTFIGESAGANASNCVENVALGYSAMAGAVSSSNNTSFGYSNFVGLSNANSNVGIGANVGMGRGMKNILIGPNVTLGDGSGNIIIGSDISVGNVSKRLQLGTLLYGDLSSGFFGVNTSAPTAAFDISGTTVFRGKVGFQNPDPVYSLDVNGSVYANGRFFGGAGTAAQPLFSFVDASATGMYVPSGALGYGAGSFGIATNGEPTAIFASNSVYFLRSLDVSGTFSASNVAFSAFSVQNGSASSPTMNFLQDVTTGLYLDTSAVLGVSTGGVRRMLVLANGDVSMGRLLASDISVSGGIFSSSGSNNIGGVTLSNGNVILTGVATNTNLLVPGWFRDTDPATNLDISGGNISNSGLTRSSNFRGSNGTAGRPTYSFVSDPSTGLHLVNGSALGFDTSGVLRMCISGGNVGIGTSRPVVALEVVGDVSAVTYNGPGGTEGAPHYTFSDDRTTGLFFPGTNIVGLTAGGVERMRISNANVGIGTKAPANALDVSGTLRVIGTAGDITLTNGAISIAGTPVISSTGVLSNAANTSNSIGGVVLSNSNVNVGAGLRGTPSLTVGDVSSGFYRESANSLTVSIAGVKTANFSNNIIEFSNSGSTALWLSNNQVQATNGTIGAPSYTFAGDPSSGIYRPTGNSFVFTIASVEQARISNNQVVVSNTFVAPALRNALTPTTYDVSGGNIWYTGSISNATLSASNQIGGVTLSNQDISLSATGRILGVATNSNRIGGVTLSNFDLSMASTGRILAPILRDAVTPLTYDISGGNIINTGLTRSSNFRGSNGTVAVPTYSFTNDPSTGLHLVNASTLGFDTAGFQRMCISGGNVGIGKLAPIFTLDVSGVVQTAGPYYATEVATNTNNAVVQILDANTAEFSSYRRSVVAGDYMAIAFRTVNNIGSATRMTIASNGNVGIGTTTPTAALEINSGGIVMNRLGNITNLTDASAIIEGSVGVGMYWQKGTNNNFCGISFKTYCNAVFAERMRIDANTGNVGIGTTAPTSLLDLSGGGINLWGIADNATARPALTTTFNNPAPAYEIRARTFNGGDGFLRIRAGQSVGEATYIDLTGFSLCNDMLRNIVFGTLSLERMRIDGNGRVGIGATAPLYTLDICGDIRASGQAYKPGGGSWVTTSDRRLKQDIERADTSLCYSIVKALPLQRFSWDASYLPHLRDKRVVGWIAQDVASVFPRAVEEKPDYGFEDLQYIDVDQIYKTLYGAVEKLIADKETLETKVSQQATLIETILTRLTALEASQQSSESTQTTPPTPPQPEAPQES